KQDSAGPLSARRYFSRPRTIHVSEREFMRRALALVVAASALAFAGAAAAEHWTKYVDVDGGLAWSYDADYSYKDSQTGRLVVMQAVSKPAANMGPGAPGNPQGVGSVIAIDCGKS